MPENPERLCREPEPARQETLTDKIHAVLKTLPFRKREIIKMRYDLESEKPLKVFTLEEVGRIFELSPSGVRAVEAKALESLRHSKRKLERFRDLLVTDGCSYPPGYFCLLQEIFGVRARPNLFDFASRELSQDAFICWLLAWADHRHLAEDRALHGTAMFLLSKLLGLHGIRAPQKLVSLDIKRQVQGLDILVLGEGKPSLFDDHQFAILIEDKIDTNEGPNQLSRYLAMGKRDYGGRSLAPVYFKTGDQSSYRAVEDAGWKCFLRRNLLEVLAYGRKQGVDNDIFADFQARLIQIELESWRNSRYGPSW